MNLIEDVDGAVYSDVLYSAMAILARSGWEDAKTYVLDVGYEADFGDIVPSWAMDSLRSQADAFATTFAERDRQTLRTIVDDGLAEGKTAGAIASDIQDAFDTVTIYNDDGSVRAQYATDAWAEMVARTELSRAQSLGQRAMYEAAGVETVEWATNGTACDECDAADGQVVKLGEEFPDVGVTEPPAHPNCCCTLIAADPDIRGTDDQTDDQGEPDDQGD